MTLNSPPCPSIFTSECFQTLSDTFTLSNPGNGDWTIRLHDNNNNGEEIAYASFTVSDFCVRIKSGLDQNLCGNNDMNAEDWAGSELKVSGGINLLEQDVSS